MSELEYQQAGLGFPPLALAAGAIPLITGLISAFKKPKKEKPQGPTKAEIEAMYQARLAQEQAEKNKMRNIAIGVGGVAVLAIGGVIAYTIWKKRKRK
jgi:hypothetical protein